MLFKLKRFEKLRIWMLVFAFRVDEMAKKLKRASASG